jgi:hypothetical protein
MDTGSCPGVESGRGVTLTPHPFLVPRPKISRAIRLLSLRAFMVYKKGETYLLNLGSKLECSYNSEAFLILRILSEIL